MCVYIYVCLYAFQKIKEITVLRVKEMNGCLNLQEATYVIMEL